MVREEEFLQITDRTWEPVEAVGSFETDDQGEPILHAANAPDAIPGFGSSTGSWDSQEEEPDAPRPSMDLEPRGRLARTAPLLSFFMFHISILLLIGIFIGASRIADLPTGSPSAEVSIFVSIPPGLTPDTATTGYSAPEAAKPQPDAANIIAAQAALAPSSSAAATLPGSPPAAPDPVPVPPTERDIQRQVLLSRGDAFLSAGDVTSARLFYQRGAEAGDGAAALRLGETFDAAFLERAHLGRVPSDVKKAVFWYRQARYLGNAEADILLEELTRRP
jgi:hypothetical protein